MKPMKNEGKKHISRYKDYSIIRGVVGFISSGEVGKTAISFPFRIMTF